MAGRYLPKTLAKTLAYITCHAPGEHGLFWEADGTMPWKELYWVLQEDPSLRFVRESNIRELTYLGIELPFELDGNLLRLRDGVAAPVYPVAEPPERLFYACRRKQYLVVSRQGLSNPANRSYTGLAANEDLALRLGHRRDPEPILIEVRAKKAFEEGILFREAGPALYLAESVPPDCLLLPLIREDELEKFALQSKKEKKPAKPRTPPTPGSFFMDLQQMREQNPDKGAKSRDSRKKGQKGPDWKREARKERRNKRSV